MNTRSPYWKLVIVEERERIGSDYYLKLTYWNGIDTYYCTMTPATIPHKFLCRDAAEERYSYIDFLRALPDDQCREIVNARRFLQVVHQSMSEASKPKVNDKVHVVDRNKHGHVWHIEGATVWAAFGINPTEMCNVRDVRPTNLEHRLAECEAAFAPEHHKELAELIYLHDGDLRERWMLFTDMLEEGRWGDKYQPWAKHILEVMQNLGRPLTIYDEVFQPDHERYTMVMGGKIQRRFVNLIASPRYHELDNKYCIGQIANANAFYDYTFTSPVSARPESNA